MSASISPSPREVGSTARPRSPTGSILDAQMETEVEASKPEPTGLGQSTTSPKGPSPRTHNVSKVSKSRFNSPQSSLVLAQGQFIAPNHLEQVQKELDMPVPSERDGLGIQVEGGGDSSRQLTVDDEGDEPESLDTPNPQPTEEHQGQMEQAAAGPILPVIDEHADESMVEENNDDVSDIEIGPLLDTHEPQPNKEHLGRQMQKTAVESTLSVIEEFDDAVSDIVVDRPPEGAPVAQSSLHGGGSSDSARSVAPPTDVYAKMTGPGAVVVPANVPVLSDTTGSDLLTSGLGQHDNHASRQEKVSKAKRRKLVGKARRLVLRKKVLTLMVGRELANTIHPILRAAPSNG